MQLSLSKLFYLSVSTVILSCALPARADELKTETNSLEVKVDTSPTLVPNKPVIATKKDAAKAAKAVKAGQTASVKKAPVAKKKTKAKLGAVTPINDFELGRYQYCGSDADCVVANNGCCDCANGGKDVAVNKERLADFQKRFDCLYSKCGQVNADPICGSGVVSCVMHKCKYFPPGEGMEDRF